MGAGFEAWLAGDVVGKVAVDKLAVAEVGKAVDELAVAEVEGAVAEVGEAVDVGLEEASPWISVDFRETGLAFASTGGDELAGSIDSLPFRSFTAAVAAVRAVVKASEVLAACSAAAAAMAALRFISSQSSLSAR